MAPKAMKAAAWGDTIGRRATGIPFLIYEERPMGLHQVLLASARWDTRVHVQQGERRITFGGVVAAAQQGAAALRAHGVGPADKVLLLGTNSVEYVLAFWAIVEAGGVVVLGNSLWSGQELEEVIDQIKPSLVLTMGQITQMSAPSVTLSDIVPMEEPSVRKEHLELPEYPRDEDDPAVILFTSGSTGRPKGAVLSHRACVAVQQSLMHLTGRLPHQLPDDYPRDLNLQTGPLFHIGGLQALIRTWLLGGTLLFLNGRGRFDPGAVVDLIEAERVRRWGAVPTMLSRVLAVPGLEDRDLSSLRSINIGGAAVGVDLIERVRSILPHAAKGVSQIYGLSEAGGTLTVASSRDLELRPGTVGKPLPVVELRIESDHGETGEVLARTPAQMTGYFGADSGSVFLAEGWLRTGDLGRMDADGYLYIIGRSKDIVIRGGENIACGHVEDTLLGCAAVREVAVFGLPDEDLGEVVGAAVFLESSASVGIDDLRSIAKEKLAYFEVPSRWWVRTLPLPTNDAGKVDKSLLQRTFPEDPATDERWATSIGEEEKSNRGNDT